jgi:hypothetical protein
LKLYDKIKLNWDETEDLEKKIAEHFVNDPDRECPNCYDMYDSSLKKPYVVCANHHLLCESCLKERRSNKIKKCIISTCK